MNLFNLTSHIEHNFCRANAGVARVANSAEVRAYARWLAQRAGMLPDMELTDCGDGRATFGRQLVAARYEGNERIPAEYEPGSYSIQFPGRNAHRDTVTLETLDEAGEVIATSTMPLDPKKGAVVWKKDAVAVAVGPIAKVAKPRKAKGAQVSAPIAKPKMEDSPVMETVANEAPAIILATTIVEPEVIAPAPIAASEPLEARLARIEAALGLAAPEPVAKRSPAHAAAIRRAWAMRIHNRRLREGMKNMREMERANHEGMIAERARADAAETALGKAAMDAGERCQLVAEIDRLRAVVAQAGNFADRANATYLAKRRMVSTAHRQRAAIRQLRAERDGLAHNIGALSQRALADARTIEALRSLPGAPSVEQPRRFILASR